MDDANKWIDTNEAGVEKANEAALKNRGYHGRTGSRDYSDVFGEIAENTQMGSSNMNPMVSAGGSKGWKDDSAYPCDEQCQSRREIRDEVLKDGLKIVAVAEEGVQKASE